MITGVIETFAICRLYRFHWPWFSLQFQLFFKSTYFVCKLNHCATLSLHGFIQLIQRCQHITQVRERETHFLSWNFRPSAIRFSRKKSLVLPSILWHKIKLCCVTATWFRNEIIALGAKLHMMNTALETSENLKHEL